MAKTVKEETIEYIAVLEERIKEYEKDISARQTGLQNLKDTLKSEKEYLATLK